MTVLQTLGPIQIIDCGFGHIAEVEMLIEDEVNLDQSKSHLPSLATKVGYSMEEVPDVEFHSDLGNTRYHRCGDWKCIAPTIILTSLTPWIRHSKLAQKKFTEVRDFFFWFATNLYNLSPYFVAPTGDDFFLSSNTY